MTTHELKIDRHWHNLLWDGVKTHEVRRADRDYQKGDRIKFIVVPGEFPTYKYWLITHVLNAGCHPGINEGFVVLSLEHPDKASKDREFDRRGTRIQHLIRSNSSLRGQITKLRKRVGAQWARTCAPSQSSMTPSESCYGTKPTSTRWCCSRRRGPCSRKRPGICAPTAAGVASSSLTHCSLINQKPCNAGA